jgi:hypothetical protein
MQSRGQLQIRPLSNSIGKEKENSILKQTTMASSSSEDERPLPTWAAYRCRFDCAGATQKKMRATIAAAKPRAEGKFVKGGAAERGLPIRPPAESAQREVKVLQRWYDSYVADAQAQMAAMQDAHYIAVASLGAKLVAKKKDLRQLRTRHRLNLRLPSLAAQRQRLLYGGTSSTTRIKLAKQLEALLSQKFATSDARKQALYEHFLRNPSDYNAITNDGITKSAFEKLCQARPPPMANLHPTRCSCDKIEEHWTLAKCLSLQIHCKLGSSKKYKRAINIMGKNYSEAAQKWIPKELYEGTGLYIPLLKGRNRVSSLRDAVTAENSITVQDESSTAIWVDLDRLVEEAIADDRAKGYLQARTQISEDTIWLHWSGDAAGWLRGLNHSKSVFKLVGNGRVVS